MHIFEDFLDPKFSKRCNFRPRKSSKSLRDPITNKLFLVGMGGGGWCGEAGVGKLWWGRVGEGKVGWGREICEFSHELPLLIW